MLITISESDFAQMPAALRNGLRRFLIDRLSAGAGHEAGPGHPATLAPAGPFELVQAPSGSRHAHKRLLRLTPAQAEGFLRSLRQETGHESHVLWTLIEELLHAGSLSPTDLAGCLGLRNKGGEFDARLVSPYLKRITFAFRRFTGIEDAAWYVLDSNGNYFLDPETLKALSAALPMVIREDEEEEPPV